MLNCRTFGAYVVNNFYFCIERQRNLQFLLIYNEAPDMQKVLIIDDDPVVVQLTSGILRKKGFEVFTAKEGKTGLQLLQEKKPDIVITDYQMPGMSGIDVLSNIREVDDAIPVIILTAYGDASLTIRSMKGGAYDFIEKPINPKELLETVNAGLASVQAGKQDDPADAVDAGVRRDENIMVGKSPAMREIFKNVGRFAQTNVGVIITGETGTGKERLARLIHHSGSQPDAPLIQLGCKNLQENQLEQALRVMKDYADKKASGTTNDAGYGTIIFDEVGMLSAEMQVTLMDYLNDHFMKDNGMQPRIISLTTQDVNRLINEGKFLKELYYKLKVFSLHIPPLRDRKEDIPVLTRHLLQELNPLVNRNVHQVEHRAIRLLKSYDWPGNVQELKNVLMQAVLLAHGERLEAKNIHLEGVAKEQMPVESPGEMPESLAEVEKAHIAKVLAYVKWNKQKASAVLGITRPTLNAKIEKYGLKR